MTMYHNYYKQIIVIWNQETDRATANNKMVIIIRDKRGTLS